MRKIFLKLLLSIVIFLTVGNSKTSSSLNITGNVNTPTLVFEQYEEERRLELAEKLRKENIRTYMHFLTDLGYIESRNSYIVINGRRYIGRFQFGWPALHTTGYKHINWRKFKKNPNIWKPEDQMIAMRRLLSINKKNMRSVLENYSGILLGDSLRVTESGLLAACHLGGSGRYQTYKSNGKIHKKGKGVKYFLQSNGEYNPSDGHMRLSDYLYMFSGYNFDIPQEEDLLTYIAENGDSY